MDKDIDDIEVKLNNLSEAEINTLRKLLLQNFPLFCSFFFKQLTGETYKRFWHIHLLQCICVDIIKQRLINPCINICPGSGKTFLMSVLFPAYCIALSGGRQKFMLLSSSITLQNKNSGLIKNLVSSDLFIELFGCKVSKDSKAKGLWNIVGEENNQSLGEIKTSTLFSSSIGGFRAGIMNNYFSGAIIIDDGNSVHSAFRLGELEKTNTNVASSIAKRRQHSRVPIINIQQRIAQNDISGFLYSDRFATINPFVKIIIPGIIDRDFLDTLPEEHRLRWTSSLKLKFDKYFEENSVFNKEKNIYEASMCEELFAYDELVQERNKQPFNFNAQVMQAPITNENNIISQLDFTRYSKETMIDTENRTLDDSSQKILCCDLAHSTRKSSDYSALVVSSNSKINDTDLCVIHDATKAKLNTDELCRTIKNLYHKHKCTTCYIEHTMGGSVIYDFLRKESLISVQLIHPTLNGLSGARIGKMARLQNISGHIKSGRVLIPDISDSWVTELFNECENFDGTEKTHDDLLDALIYSVMANLVMNTRKLTLEFL